MKILKLIITYDESIHFTPYCFTIQWQDYNNTIYKADGKSDSFAMAYEMACKCVHP